MMPKRVLAELCSALDVAVMQHVEDGRFANLGSLPDWLMSLWPEAPKSCDGGCSLGERFPFLANFLIDAEAHWHSGAVEPLRSGNWTETDRHGTAYHLEALAVLAADRQILLIQPMAVYEERQMLVQRGRENKLLHLRELAERDRTAAHVMAEKEAADAATRAKSEFLASMSHELRTPLNSIIGFTNILVKNKGAQLDERDLTFLKRIQDNGKHLLDLINDILDLSKIEAGHMLLDPSEVRIDHLVREVAGELDGQARARGVRLEVELPEEIVPIKADARRLKQVLINLVGNGLKFTHEGAVTVRVAVDRSTGEPTRIDVSDTGIGIPADQLAGLFEAFRQADTGTQRRYEGTGLGLTISRSLCNLMGFGIEVASVVGEGTTFTVTLARGH